MLFHRACDGLLLLHKICRVLRWVLSCKSKGEQNEQKQPDSWCPQTNPVSHGPTSFVSTHLQETSEIREMSCISLSEQRQP